MNNKILENCPKCNNNWSQISEEGTQKIYTCSKCNYTKFYDLSSPNENDINSILKELQKSNVPKVITASYDNLISLLENDEVYGALIKIKDIFELLIKLPLVVMLSHISNKVYQRDSSTSDFINEFSSLHALLQEFIHDAVSYQLTLGNWITIAGEIKSTKVADLFKNTGDKNILETLYRINQINHKAFTSNKYGEPVAAWRNKTIGHGALNCNKEEVRRDILAKLKLLNTVLNDTEEEYSKIDISIDKDFITIKSTSTTSNIVVEPFITLIKDRTQEKREEDYQLDNLLIFDSYNNKKHISHVINHANGQKNQSENLTKVLTFINANLKEASNLALINGKNMGSLTDDTIYSDEIEILNALQSSTFYQGSYFSDWFINCIENYSGGVFLCCAERGMGKSSFSRAVNQNETIKIENNDKLKDYLTRKVNLLIRTFHFNSYYNSSIVTFLKVIKDIFTTELKESNNISYLHSIDYISEEIEDLYSHLRYSLKASTPFNSQHKILFLNFLKTLLSIWRKKYGKDKLVIILDGIDEIKSGSTNINIADLIPTPEEIKAHNLKDIYIILTSRCKDEVVSNFNLYKFLDCGIFNDKLELKRENKGSKYDSPYSKTFIASIQKDLINKVGDETKKYSYDEAIQLAEQLDWRFNYLAAYKKMYLRCTEDNLQNFTNDPFSTYINYLDKLSRAYSQDIQLLLNLLALTEESLTINEISFLLTGDNTPSFKLYGMLMDISNFLIIERDYRRGALFNLSHIDWVENIKANSSLQKSKKLLINKLTSLFIDLIHRDLTTTDFSISDFDGETWLISNINKTNFNIQKNILSVVSLLDLDFGDNQYQIIRSIRLYEYCLKNFKHFNQNDLNLFLLPNYILICCKLINFYFETNDTKNGEKIYNLLTDICNNTAKNTLTTDYFCKKQLSTAYNALSAYIADTNPHEAISLSHKSIEICEQLVNDYKNGGDFFSKYDLATSYATHARLLETINHKESIIFYHKAIAIFEQYDYQYDLAASYNNLASLLKTINPNEAESLLHKAINLCEQLANDYKNGGDFFNLKYLAISYNNLAGLLVDSRPNEAFSLYHKAIAIHEQLANDYENGGRFFDLNNLAISYINLAVFLETTNLDEAITLRFKAIAIYEQLANDYENGGRFFDLNSLAKSYANLAELLKSANPDKAIELYQDAINIREQLANDYKNGGNFFDLETLSALYNNLAILIEPANYEEAEMLYRKTIAIDEQLANDYKNGGRFFDLETLITSYKNFAAFLEPITPNESATFFRKAIAVHKQLVNNAKNEGPVIYNIELEELAFAYYEFAIYIESINPNEAIELYQNAIYIREQLSQNLEDECRFYNLNSLANTYDNLAMLLESTNANKDIVLTNLNKSITIREQLANDSKNSSEFLDLNQLKKSYEKRDSLLKSFGVNKANTQKSTIKTALNKIIDIFTFKHKV